jgi:ubiquinone/menaquinone biosynthesis C-methylase UbiE
MFAASDKPLIDGAVPMVDNDSLFAGSIPALYDQFLVPLLFAPYAADMAERIASWAPRDILETAAGTGIVTAAISERLPDSTIVATDLNQAMLDVAAQNPCNRRVKFRAADALDLPFDESSFDVVACQFGVMFYPDRVKGHREAARVLRDGGRYLIAVWDSIDRNPGSKGLSDAVASLFPDDPPRFLDRTPFGYSDPDEITRDLHRAGFGEVEIETVEHRSRAPSARDVAKGLCMGSPLRGEIEARDPSKLDEAVDAATAAIAEFEGPDGFEAPMSALLVTATK